MKAGGDEVGHAKPELPPVFVSLLQEVAERIGDRSIEPGLADFLTAQFHPDSLWFGAMTMLCRQGCDEGWLCAREHGGIRFGRVISPTDDLRGFSVDVVEMDDVVGPHHSHPNGEIDLIMPYDGGAAFDGVSKGWKVYGPGSAHNPTVTGGKALVLYLLPEGAIEFTRG